MAPKTTQQKDDKSVNAKYRREYLPKPTKPHHKTEIKIIQKAKR